MAGFFYTALRTFFLNVMLLAALLPLQAAHLVHWILSEIATLISVIFDALRSRYSLNYAVGEDGEGALRRTHWMDDLIPSNPITWVLDNLDLSELPELPTFPKLSLPDPPEIPTIPSMADIAQSVQTQLDSMQNVMTSMYGMRTMVEQIFELATLNLDQARTQSDGSSSDSHRLQQYVEQIRRIEEQLRARTSDLQEKEEALLRQSFKMKEAVENHILASWSSNATTPRRINSLERVGSTRAGHAESSLAQMGSASCESCLSTEIPVCTTSEYYGSDARETLSHIKPSANSDRDDGTERCALLQQALMDQLECGICLDVLIDPITLSCGHSACRFCFVKLIHNSKSRFDDAKCPWCKTPLPAEVHSTKENVVLKNMAHFLRMQLARDTPQHKVSLNQGFHPLQDGTMSFGDQTPDKGSSNDGGDETLSGDGDNPQDQSADVAPA